MATLARVVLIGLGLASLALGGAVLVRSSVAGDVDPPHSVVTATVERRTLQDVLVLRGTVQHQPTARLRLQTDGRVTGLMVAPGALLEDGAPVLEVDGRVVLAAAGAFPFWRDLGYGDDGRDVRQLQEMLSRAGHDPVVDGKFGHGTLAALRAWQQALAHPVDGRFRAGDVLVAALPARVGEVLLEVGDVAAPGLEAVVLTAGQADVRFELTPSSRLQVGVGQEAIVQVTATGTSASGVVSDLSDVPVRTGGASDGADGDRYTGRIDLKGDLQAVEGADVRVTIVLASAPDELTVPVAALVLDGQGRPGVRVVAPGGEPEFRPVETGASEGAYVAITGEVSVGDLVVLGQEPDER